MSNRDRHGATTDRPAGVPAGGVVRRVSYALLVVAGMSVLVRLFVPGLPPGLTSALNVTTLPAVVVAIGLHLWADMRAGKDKGTGGGGGGSGSGEARPDGMDGTA